MVIVCVCTANKLATIMLYTSLFSFYHTSIRKTRNVLYT